MKQSIGLMIQKFVPQELAGFREWNIRMKGMMDQLMKLDVESDPTFSD